MDIIKRKTILKYAVNTINLLKAIVYLICSVTNTLNTAKTTYITKQSTTTQVWIAYVCVCVTHNGTGLCDEEEFGEGSMKRKQHSDTGRILA